MSDKNSAIELQQQYASGTRQFAKAQLEAADLADFFLSRIDLTEANLDRANLKNADLSDANLEQASLVGAVLEKAHLSRINFTDANLREADFTRSLLSRANFTEANLNQARFALALLIEANFEQADLSGANLSEVDLSTANLEGAIYDERTTFPAGFNPESRGMSFQPDNKLGMSSASSDSDLEMEGITGDYTVEELISQFDRLCQCSNKYLGNTITAKYFNSTRPDFEWLNQFEINKFSQISFQGTVSDLASLQQLRSFHKWMNSFINSCSAIVKDFDKIARR